MRAKTFVSGLLACALSACAFGDDLTIGDKAPAVDIEHWVRGDQVADFENDKVYVVEFWATWCGPCRASMPHISKLQNEYKDYDVRFIGVSDEKLDTVTNFLGQEREEGQTWDEVIDYTLTTDPDKSVYNDYMKAAGQRGIPTAFIVGKDGHVEWIGHPMNIDEPIAAVVHDKWDRAAFKREFDTRREIDQLLESGKYEEAIARIDTLLESGVESLDLMWRKFNLHLTELDQPQKAYAVAEKLTKHVWDNPQMLNSISWTILDDPRVSERNIPMAMKLAKRASELTDHKDAAILDTLARAYYEQGDLDQALEWQRKAVDAAGDGPMAESLREVLEKYEEESKN